MRLWSLHPAYLDRQGLTALWREGLLAQAVLAGRTRGYTNHPQLDRFRGDWALSLVGAYLLVVADEATARGYRYDVSRLDQPLPLEQVPTLAVTSGQVALEWRHLMSKLRGRSPDLATRWEQDSEVQAGGIRCHPMFQVVPGPVEAWERATVA